MLIGYFSVNPGYQETFSWIFSITVFNQNVKNINGDDRKIYNIIQKWSLCKYLASRIKKKEIRISLPLPKLIINKKPKGLRTHNY